jgi:hypothetical protein
MKAGRSIFPDEILETTNSIEFYGGVLPKLIYYELSVCVLERFATARLAALLISL